MILFLLLCLGCNESKRNLEEDCENFQFSGTLYKGEKVLVRFNSKLLHEDYFEDKAWSVLHGFCVNYTDTFTVDLKVLKGNGVVIDTSMMGYAKNGNYLLRLPKGDPKPNLVEKIWADTTGKLYRMIPPDSLVRRAFLETGTIVTD